MNNGSLAVVFFLIDQGCFVPVLWVTCGVLVNGSQLMFYVIDGNLACISLNALFFRLSRCVMRLPITRVIGLAGLLLCSLVMSFIFGGSYMFVCWMG